MEYRKRGKGLISSVIGTVLNKTIDLLPTEFHLPGGYQYCGPGTNLEKRLKRGDPGINELDRLCKNHDISYLKYKDSKNRAIADNILAEGAWKRVISPDASVGERAAAYAVTNIMKAKAKLGSGYKKRKTSKRKKRSGCSCGKGLYLRHYKKSGGSLKQKKKISKKK
jgi:hypothetical protein